MATAAMELHLEAELEAQAAEVLVLAVHQQRQAAMYLYPLVPTYTT